MVAESHLGGVHRLVRQGALSHTDWLGLIEERRTLIEPHLKTMDLKNIGDVVVADYSNNGCQIRGGNPEIFSAHPHYTLEARCWWPTGDGLYSGRLVSSLTHHFDPPGTVPAVGCTDTFWVLTRNGKWLVVEAKVKFPDRRQSWEQLLKSKVERVTIREVSVPNILATFPKTTPKDIWLQLGKLSKQWYARRQELLTDAERLTEAFALEEQLLGYIERK